YLVYWGAMEPLGQALVIPQVVRMAGSGTRVTLVTFEKPDHLADGERFRIQKRDLHAVGIDWIPLRYHQRPTAPATAFDTFHGFARSVLASLRGRPDLVHGRTYVGGVIGSLVARFLRRPSIFHNEGFWPDEQIASGRWTAASRGYRATKSL